MEQTPSQTNQPIATVQHDFRFGSWGWNIVKAWQLKDEKFKLMGIGNGIKTGHIILMRSDQGEDIPMLVEDVKYDKNPRDLFIAIVSVIAHTLTEK